MKHINDLIHELDGADLYLRNRTDTSLIPLNTCDIEEMLAIAKTVDSATRVLEKSIIPPCNIRINCPLWTKAPEQKLPRKAGEFFDEKR